MATRISGSVLLLTTLAFSLVVGDVLARSAQDPQTQPATPQTQPTPQKKTTTKRKRGQMKMNAPANETTTGDQTTPATPADQTPAATTTPAQTAMPAQNMASTQTDLSGTYAGTFNCDALGLTGDTTLTINGNEFSTADGKTGRIVASTTHGYTAVALQTGAVPGAATTTAPAATTTAPTIVSLRARKSGSRLTLMPVSGGTPCSFAPGRSVARRSRQTSTAAGTTVASPAEAGPTPAEVTAPAKPARTRRGSTRTTTPATMPNPAETPAQPTQPTPETPIPSQTPSPEPNPSPMPRPTPTVSPEPQPTPTGSPSPMPSPTPSPTPSPSPRPRG